VYRHLLVPIDVNDRASHAKALPTAVRLAETFGARLHVMTVVPEFGMAIVGQQFPKGFAEKARAAAEAELRRIVEAQVPAALDADLGVAHGSVYQEILHIARDLPADLIVMGSHRPALRDYLLGPNAARVVRHADCSVMVVRD
jgi:nucleotide-binding universal stress UspA family protein